MIIWQNIVFNKSIHKWRQKNYSKLLHDSLLILIGLPLSLIFYKVTLITLFQNKLIYIPYWPLGSKKKFLASPFNLIKDVNLKKKLKLNEKLNIVTADGVTLNGWLFQHNHQSSLSPLMIYFQG